MLNKQEENNRLRNWTISYLRVAAMLLVILGHGLAIYSSRVSWPFEKNVVWYWNDLCAIIYSFHMPVFFVISGYLYSYLYLYQNKYHNVKFFLIDKSKRLLLPYVFWGLIQFFLFDGLFTMCVAYSGGFHLWFLLTLFWNFVFFAFANKIWMQTSSKKLMSGLIVLLVVLTIGHLSYYLPKILCLRFAVFNLPYFLFGVILGKKQAYKDFYISRILLLFINLLLFIFVAIIALIEPFDKYGGFFSFCKNICVMGYIFTIYRLLCGKIVRNQFIQKFMISLDKCSMGIYIIHHIVIWLILSNAKCFQWLISHCNVGPIVLFLLSLVLSYILTYAIQKNSVIKVVFG